MTSKRTNPLPIANGGAGRATNRSSGVAADTRTQAEKFEAAARELGCDEDEDQLKGVLRKLAKPKLSIKSL